MHENINVRPLFSIITVCRNAEELIGSTISSLANQSFQDFEYLIVDGASKDKTLSVVQDLAAKLPLHLVSEPDEGVYYAMNKGIRMAQGEWIYFLNAGDDFVDSSVLLRVSALLKNAPDCEIAYGDVIYRGASGKRLVRFDWLSRDNLLFENLCHQSVFGRRTAFERLGLFDTQFQINADYDWLLRVFRSGAPFKYLGIPISYYDDMGLSAREQVKLKAERVLVRNQYLPKGLGSSFQYGYRAYRKLLRMARLTNR